MLAVTARVSKLGASMAILAPLRSRDYRLYWLGAAISQAGDQFQMVALAILALNLTGSAATLGAVLTVQAVPRTLLMLVGGVAVDRFRPRSILLGSNALLTVVSAALALAAASGELTLWHLYAYAALAGTLYAFAVPAQQTIVPELVPVERLRSATALRTTTFNLTLSLVPPVAGALVAWAGAAPAFALNALSFAVAAACLWPVRTPGSTSRVGGESALAQLKGGFSATWAAPVLLTAIVSGTAYSLGYEGATLVGVPALAKLTLGTGDLGVGVLYGVGGAGALLGTIAIGSVSRGPRQGLLGGWALVATGLSLAAVALAPSLAIAATFFGAACALQAVCVVTYVTVVQANAPPEVRGRVMSLFFLGVMGLAPLSLGVGGLIADSLGPRGVFVAGGAAVVAAGLYSLSRAEFRRLP